MRLLLISPSVIALALIIAGCSKSHTKHDQDDPGADGSDGVDSGNAFTKGETDGGGSVEPMDADTTTTNESDTVDRYVDDSAVHDTRSNNRDDDVLRTPIDEQKETDDSDAGTTDIDDITPDAGISDAASEADGSDISEQRVVFEKTYVNYAWGYALSGQYIDTEGNIYSYNHSQEEWNPIDPNRITEAELREKYSNSELQSTIDPETILDYRNLIDAAADGPFLETEQIIFDAGTVTFVAYLYDSSDSTYIPVLLVQGGETNQTNLSLEALTLSLWLAQVFEE